MLHELNAPLTNSYLLALSLEAKQLYSQKKKTCSQKVQKLKKKEWFRWGLNLQLGWLTTVVYVVLTGMYNSCSPYSLYPTAFNVM